ncbi:MAG: hypothetical protein ACP5F6_00695 [Microbacter sp.]
MKRKDDCGLMYSGMKFHRRIRNVKSRSAFLFLLGMMFVLLLAGCYHTSDKDAALLQHAGQILDQHPDSALHLLERIAHPEKLTHHDYADYALLYTKAQNKLHITPASDSLIRVAVSYFSSAHESEKLAQAYFYLSRYYRFNGNKNMAANWLMQAEHEATTQQPVNAHLFGMILSDKAQIYYDQNQLDSAIFTNKKALLNFRVISDNSNCAISLLDIGKSFTHTDYIDSALFYFQQALKFALQAKDTIIISTAERLVGYQLYKLKRYRQALAYLQHSLKTSSDSYNAGKFLNIGMVYMAMNEDDRAKQYFLKSLQQSPDLRLKSASYQQLLYLSEKRRQIDQVVHYAEMYVDVNDSIYQQSLSTSLAGIEKRYNYERIAGINKSLIIRQQHTYIWLLFAAFLLALGSGFFFFYRDHQKKVINRLIKDQLKLQQAKLEKLELLQRIAHLRFIPRSNLEQTGAQFWKLFAKEIDMTSPNKMGDLIDAIDSAYDDVSKRLQSRFPLLSQK